MRRTRSGVAPTLACALLGLVPGLTGCIPLGDRGAQVTPAAAELSVLAGSEGPAARPEIAVPAPGRLRGPLRSPDLIVVGSQTLPRGLRRAVAGTEGVEAVVTLGLATAPVRGRMVTIGAVEPGKFRRFTPEVTARTTAVWERVSEGDLALSSEVADELDQPLGGDLTLGNQTGALSLRVGATASMTPGIDAVLNRHRGEQLGMLSANAMLVSTGGTDSDSVVDLLRRRLGERATVSSLVRTPAAEGTQTASLAGGSVADAVGGFRYRYSEDGTVAPDPSWVASNIRTESVPLLGRVTCHSVMLPQLRGALQEVVDRGLAAEIDTEDYGGCYAPRFIGRDPDRGLSLHTWGIAVDLNVRGNLRGTVGEIDRRVVEVFKRWGFAWGGDWSFTDPMHFELAALVRPVA